MTRLPFALRALRTPPARSSQIFAVQLAVFARERHATDAGGEGFTIASATTYGEPKNAAPLPHAARTRLSSQF
jgi:hypothetical protein